MKTGTVKWFNLQKGYGFIHPDDGGPNIFVHKSAVESAGLSDLKEGQRMIFRDLAERAHRRPIRHVVDTAFVCNDTASRRPFRHDGSVRYHFRLHLIDNVGSVSVRKEGGLTRARTRLPRPICLAENRGALRVSRNDRTCGDGYG